MELVHLGDMGRSLGPKRVSMDRNVGELEFGQQQRNRPLVVLEITISLLIHKLENPCLVQQNARRLVCKNRP